MAVVERWPLLGRRGVMTPLFFRWGVGGKSTTCLLCLVMLIVTYNGN